MNHLETRSHVEKVITKKINYLLQTASSSSSNYGLHPMHREYQQQNPILPKQSDVTLCDRVTHMEDMALSFVAERNLPFVVANNVVELANEMLRDPLAAKKLKRSRTVVSYKLRDGLAKGLEEELIE